MSAKFGSRPETIGSLLGRNERRSISLPRFQRGFSWEKSQVAAFWKDLMEFKAEFDRNRVAATYFLGPIVLRETETEIVLLDGQQRLASATIMLGCLRDVARALPLSAGSAGSDLARDIQSGFIEKEDTLPPQYSLCLGELDEHFFAQSVKADPPKSTSATIRSHKLIETAYRFLYDEVSNLVQGKDVHVAIALLKGIRDCLVQGMSMVAICVESEEDAYSIFEALNDRGLRLSVPDLLLNLLMKKAGDAQNRNRVRGKWNEMLQQMGRRDISRFLRHMWVSKYGDLKARGLFAEMKEHLLENSIGSLEFAEMCAQECEKYVSILDVDAGVPVNARPAVTGLVKELNATSTYPLLLAGLVCLSDGDFVKLTSLAVGLVVRHSVLSNLNPADLESAMYEAARELRGKRATKEKSTRCLQAAKERLAKANPADSVVFENARDVDLDRRQASWVMREVARRMQSKTAEIGFDKVSLEHVFPLNAGAEWPNRKNLEPYVWRIGNLTVLGTKLNNDAKSKAFAVKCKNYYARSEITITKELLQYTQWTEQEIGARGEKLVKTMTGIWVGP